MPSTHGAPAETATTDRFRLLVDAVQDYGIFMLDPEGVVVSWNSGAQRIKQYRPEEVIGRHYSLFYPSEAVAAKWPDEELRRAAKDGRFEEEGWRLRKDGTRFWANVVITALRDASGALTGYGKVTRDLSERRLHEEALRESEQRFRLLVESVRDYAIFMLSPEGIIESWNSGAQLIKG
ncbi:MAG: PAS domain-containing protein, partial [Polaromonas sp.]|nr:PAS domain-containing protein [Polaromonas sp.]